MRKILRFKYFFNLLYYLILTIYIAIKIIYFEKKVAHYHFGIYKLNLSFQLLSNIETDIPRLNSVGDYASKSVIQHSKN